MITVASLSLLRLTPAMMTVPGKADVTDRGAGPAISVIRPSNTDISAMVITTAWTGCPMGRMMYLSTSMPTNPTRAADSTRLTKKLMPACWNR